MCGLVNSSWKIPEFFTKTINPFVYCCVSQRRVTVWKSFRKCDTQAYAASSPQHCIICSVPVSWWWHCGHIKMTELTVFWMVLHFPQGRRATTWDSSNSFLLLFLLFFALLLVLEITDAVCLVHQLPFIFDSVGFVSVVYLLIASWLNYTSVGIWLHADLQGLNVAPKNPPTDFSFFPWKKFKRPKISPTPQKKSLTI